MFWATLNITDHVSFGGEYLLCHTFGCHPFHRQSTCSINGSVVLLFLDKSRQTKVRHLHYSVFVNPTHSINEKMQQCNLIS